jgi:hypothetical protein
MTDTETALDELINEGPQPIVAMLPQQATKPAFRLIALGPRTVERTVAVRDTDGFKFVKEKHQVEGGYLLKAYKGHSVYIPSLNELRSRGLDVYVPMINSDNDEVVGMTHTSAVTTKQSNKAA